MITVPSNHKESSVSGQPSSPRQPDHSGKRTGSPFHPGSGLPDSLLSRKKVGKYSLGMKQRLGIAQAIMEDPEILILDVKLSILIISAIRKTLPFLIFIRLSFTYTH